MNFMEGRRCPQWSRPQENLLGNPQMFVLVQIFNDISFLTMLLSLMAILRLRIVTGLSRLKAKIAGSRSKQGRLGAGPFSNCTSQAVDTSQASFPPLMEWNSDVGRDCSAASY